MHMYSHRTRAISVDLIGLSKEKKKSRSMDKEHNQRSCRVVFYAASFEAFDAIMLFGHFVIQFKINANSALAIIIVVALR